MTSKLPQAHHTTPGRIDAFALTDGEALTAYRAEESDQAVQRDPVGAALPPTLRRNEEVCSDGEAAGAIELTAEFEKHFPAGPIIIAKLRRPTDARSPTILFGPSGSGKSTTL